MAVTGLHCIFQLQEQDFAYVAEAVVILIAFVRHTAYLVLTLLNRKQIRQLFAQIHSEQ